MTAELLWPIDRFFWAVLDAPAIRPGAVPVGLLQLLQEELPQALEDVHAVCAGGADGKVIVCVARRKELRGLPEGCLRLTPEAMPALLASDVAVSSLNLLVGDFEPAPLQKERARRKVLVMLAAAAVLCLIAVGLDQRAKAWFRAGEEARAATASVGTNPVALRAELERLRKAPRERRSMLPTDASVALAAVLSGWPKDLECQTESVSITPGGMAFSLNVAKDARPFLSALKAPEGWTMDEPRLAANGESSRLGLTLRRKEARP